MAACSRNDPVARGSINAFGTTLEITLSGIDRRRANAITRTLAGDMRSLEAALDAINDGPLSRMNFLFNESARPFAAAPSVLPLLQLSQQLSERSDGLFDPAP